MTSITTTFIITLAITFIFLFSSSPTSMVLAAPAPQNGIMGLIGSNVAFQGAFTAGQVFAEKKSAGWSGSLEDDKLMAQVKADPKAYEKVMLDAQQRALTKSAIQDTKAVEQEISGINDKNVIGEVPDFDYGLNDAFTTQDATMNDPIAH